jgi:hypothetical protein
MCINENLPLNKRSVVERFYFEEILKVFRELEHWHLIQLKMVLNDQISTK